MLAEPISKIFPNQDSIAAQDYNSSPNQSSLSQGQSFSNVVDPNEILPYKSFITENIKSFNLLPNEVNTYKETELENSLKAKYNFDTPTLELILKVTSDYESIKEKLKEFLDLFGENTIEIYDHNANTVKMNYKYYFSCLYAYRSLTNILQKENDNSNTINYYHNCEFSSQSITSIMNREEYHNTPKDISQAFKFLTDNYKPQRK